MWIHSSTHSLEGDLNQFSSKEKKIALMTRQVMSIVYYLVYYICAPFLWFRSTEHRGYGWSERNSNHSKPVWWTRYPRYRGELSAYIITFHNSCNYYNRKCNTIGRSDFFTRFSLCKKRIAGIKVKSSSLLSSHSEIKNL